MAAKHRTPVLALVMLLAVATAAADTVITAEEVIACSVESAYPDFVFLGLTRRQHKMLSTRDIYELRLSDSSRVAELTTQLPQVRVVLDSGQAVPPPATRNREMLRLRLDWARKARAEGLFWYPDVIDTLARGASPAQMAKRCEDMDVVLDVSGRYNETVAGLLHEVKREEEALRRIRSTAGTLCLSGALGAVLGGTIGAFALAAVAESQNSSGVEYAFMYGCLAGSVAGPGIGVALGAAQRRAGLARHRNRVNDLVRRVNHAVVTAP